MKLRPVQERAILQLRATAWTHRDDVRQNVRGATLMDLEGLGLVEMRAVDLPAFGTLWRLTRKGAKVKQELGR